MVVVVWWSGDGLLHWQNYGFWHSESHWESWRRTSMIWCSSAVGLCCKTTIWSRRSSPPLNGLKETKLIFWSGRVKVQPRNAFKVRSLKSHRLNLVLCYLRFKLLTSFKISVPNILINSCIDFIFRDKPRAVKTVFIYLVSMEISDWSLKNLKAALLRSSCVHVQRSWLRHGVCSSSFG